MVGNDIWIIILNGQVMLMICPFGGYGSLVLTISNQVNTI